MIRRALTVAVLMATRVGVAQEPAAPPRTLDVVPRSELGALLIRHTDDLRGEAGKLIGNLGLTIDANQAVEMGLYLLGVKEGFDRSAPVGVVWLQPPDDSREDIGIDRDSLAFAIPYADRAKMAGNLGIAADSRAVQKLDEKTASRGFPRAARLTDRYLLISGSNRSEIVAWQLGELAEGERLAAALTDHSQAELNKADVLLHVGAGKVLKHHPEWLRALRNSLGRFTDEEEQLAAARVAEALPQLQHLFLSVDVDAGLSAAGRLLFDPQAESASRLLDTLRKSSSDDASAAMSFTGLPDGPLLAAFSTRLTTASQQLLFRALARLAALGVATDGRDRGGLSSLLQGWNMTDVRQFVLLGALAEVAAQADEICGGVYASEHDAGVVLILRSPRPDQLIVTIRELCDDVTQALADDSREIDAAEVRKLIRELTSDEFAVRNRATTRLLLLGAKVRPALADAAKSSDSESAARASKLLTILDAGLEQREQQLLNEPTLANVHPRLTYRIGQSQLAGRAIDQIDVTLPQEEAPQQAQLEGLFGAGWNRVQLAQTNDAVVLTFGAVSDGLVRTLANLDAGKDAVRGREGLTRLPADPARLLEAYLPLGKLIEQAKTPKTPAEKKPFAPPVLSGLGFSSQGNEVSLEVSLPPEELRAIYQARGLW